MLSQILSTFLSGIYLIAVAACCTGVENLTLKEFIGDSDSR